MPAPITSSPLPPHLPHWLFQKHKESWEPLETDLEPCMLHHRITLSGPRCSLHHAGMKVGEGGVEFAWFQHQEVAEPRFKFTFFSHQPPWSSHSVIYSNDKQLSWPEIMPKPIPSPISTASTPCPQQSERKSSLPFCCWWPFTYHSGPTATFSHLTPLSTTSILECPWYHVAMKFLVNLYKQFLKIKCNRKEKSKINNL